MRGGGRVGGRLGDILLGELLLVCCLHLATQPMVICSSKDKIDKERLSMCINKFRKAAYLVQLLSPLVDGVLGGVVEPGVGPHLGDVAHTRLKLGVEIVLQSRLDGGQVHGAGHNLEIKTVNFIIIVQFKNKVKDKALSSPLSHFNTLERLKRLDILRSLRSSLIFVI